MSQNEIKLLSLLLLKLFAQQVKPTNPSPFFQTLFRQTKNNTTIHVEQRRLYLSKIPEDSQQRVCQSGSIRVTNVSQNTYNLHFGVQK